MVSLNKKKFIEPLLFLSEAATFARYMREYVVCLSKTPSLSLSSRAKKHFLINFIFAFRFFVSLSL